MPLPFILGVGAAVAGVTGVGSGIRGAVKMKDANDTMKMVEKQHNRNTTRFEENSKITNKKMDELGTFELNILKSFDTFSDIIEKIQNRPEFKEYKMEGVQLPKYDAETIKEVSVGAGVLLGGLGGAAVGTAGGFAAAGATTSAVMALGTASTGTAIASLSGAAATNATLAALGGGALSAGGGGIALGTSILGAATVGVGLLVGGAIFNVTGGKLSDKAEEARKQVEKEEKTINKICLYLEQLNVAANRFYETLRCVKQMYDETIAKMKYIVYDLEKTDWNMFDEREKMQVQNAVLLVQLLYKMCQISLVNKAENEDGMNSVNQKEINNTIDSAEEVMRKVA